MSYACPATSLVYVALGSDEEVHREMHQAENDFEQLLSSMQEIDDDSDMEEAIMQILEKIQLLDKKGKLFCTCGNHELFVDILDSDVILMCGDCGQSIKIDAANDDEIDAFLELEEIILKSVK